MGPTGMITRTRSVIEKEVAMEGAPKASSNSSVAEVENVEIRKIDAQPQPIIAQRVTKLSQLYDVDFGEAGVLGTGTFSTVRVATHKSSGIKYAVKAISLLEIQTPTLVRLRREIQVLRSLQNPNIISLYEIFEENNNLFMVMEMCKGGELWHFLQGVEIHANGEKFYHTKKGRMPLNEAKVASIVR